MSTIDEIFATISEEDVSANIDELLVIDPTTRQISLPSSELVFGVESDGRAERKYFQCPRYLGNNLDITSCFIRVNYRNANGEIDSHLVEDVTVRDDVVLFSWELHEKVTKYMGNIQFLVCAYRADKVEWNTTIATGLVLEGLEPDVDGAVEETGDLVAQLLETVEAQISAVKAEGATQITAVKASAKATEAEILNEIEAKGTNTLASIPNDYTALGEAVGALERMAAPGIVCEAEGTSIVVADASNSPVQNLRIFGRSTQDGTPTPDNPVEIQSVTNPVVTVAGKNLLPFSYKNGTYTTNGGTFTARDDGGVDVSGTPTGYVFLSLHSFGKNFAGKVTFALLGAFSNCVMEVIVRDGKNAILTSNSYIAKTYTVNFEQYPTYATVTCLLKRKENNVEMTGTVYPMVVMGDTAPTKYESYIGQTPSLTHTLQGIPVASGGNYTDSDGQQWICDEVDFERGVYVQRIGEYVVTGNENWERSNLQILEEQGYYRYDANSIPKAGSPMADTLVTHFPYAYSPNYVKGFWLYNDPNSRLALRVMWNYSTAEELKAFLSAQYSTGTPVVVNYILATPIETPLTEAELASFKALHTNKPHTTVLNDQSAHTELSYVADTKIYIDRKIESFFG